MLGLQRRVEQLVADFEASPLAARKSIHEAWSNDHEGFLRGAIPILAASKETHGLGFLLSFLLQHEPLAVRLGNPELCTREEALLIARRASQLDRTFERQISQLLMGGIQLETEEATRLLAILESIADPAGFLPVLSAILRNRDPRIRSKAALLMGKGNRNSGWVRQQLMEGDGRVRANAVESLWGIETEEALDVFLHAAQDHTPRVVINGAIGLYRAGQTRSIEILMGLGRHEGFEFRRSACWGMGNSKDPRFLPVLAKLIRDGEATVRSNALRASSAIRAHLNTLKKSPLAVYIGEWTILESGVRRLAVSLRHPVTNPVPELGPLAFALEEDGVPVQRYEVSPCTSGHSTSIGIVLPIGVELPAPFGESLPPLLWEALGQKPDGEFWAAARYSNCEIAEPEGTGLLPEVTGTRERKSTVAMCGYHTGLLRAVEAVDAAMPAGGRAIVVIGSIAAESTSAVFHHRAHLEEVAGVLRSRKAAIHGILFPGCTPLFRSTLEYLAKETGGSVREFLSPEELSRHLTHRLASFNTEYSIRYWGFEERPAAKGVRLVVTTGTSYGESEEAVEGKSG